MFKPQKQNVKPSPSSSGEERVDFRFSNFQALQVPKGWDRLSLSIISAGTGKVIAKLGKTVVRTGSCQWPETLLESVWISQDDSSAGIEEYMYKCVVSMGSARSGILGEATLNLASYVSSRTASLVSLPLKKCNYGTILQVKIHCLTPRAKLRDEESNGSNSLVIEQNVDYHDKSFGLVEGFMRRDELFFKNHLKNEGSNQSSSPHDSFLFDDDHSARNQSSLKIENLQHYGKDLGSSEKLLEAAEETIEELRIEAKMWERNARKLMIDLDVLRNEFSDQSKKQADLVMELSTAYAEHDSLKKEIENLKQTWEESKEREDSTFQSQGLIHIHEELESEIKHQKELNNSLSLQLQRSQESNIELVSVLQELEDTIEQQKVEIENLSSMQLKFQENKISNAELEVQCSNLQKELAQNRYEVDRLKDDLLRKEEETNFLMQQKRELDNEVADLQKKKDQLEEDVKILSGESNDLQNNLKILGENMDKQMYDYEVLQRRSEEIECENKKLENELMKLKEENLYLESQMSYIATERDSCHLENQKLHGSIENLLEEIKILQKSNLELREKNVEMHEYCDDQLKQSEKSLCDSYKKVEILEEKINSFVKDFSSKEEKFNSELDELVRENKIQMEKLTQQEISIQMSQENLVEVESLRKQVENQQLLDLKVQELKIELAGSKQSYEKLIADNERMLKLLTNYRTTEEKLKKSMNDLELKLTISHCEHQQLLEDTVSFKFQLQKMTQLQDEVSDLRSQLYKCRNEKEQLEATIQEADLEFKNCKGEKVSLEEKLLQMEDLGNELTKIKRENKLYEQRIYQLEEEKDKSLKRILALEANIEEDRQNCRKAIEYANGSNGTEAVDIEKIKSLENKLAETLEANKKFKIQLQRFRSEERKTQGGASKRAIAENESAEREKFEQIKSSLESELKDIRERYFEMSLKYAEVEAQRENLVMKLKASNSGKKWFS